MAFESFFVECQTCSRRLRVTDPAVVGTISVCPNCGSMVKVQYPGGAMPVASRGGSDTASDSETAFDPAQSGSTANELDSLPRSPRQVALGNESVDSETITRDAIPADQLDSIDPGITPPEFFQGSDSAPTPSIADSAPPIDPEFWQSEGTRKSRQVAMIVAISAVSLLTAVVVFFWFVRSRRESIPITAPNAAEIVQDDSRDVDAKVATDRSDLIDASALDDASTTAALPNATLNDIDRDKMTDRNSVSADQAEPNAVAALDAPVGNQADPDKPPERSTEQAADNLMQSIVPPVLAVDERSSPETEAETGDTPAPPTEPGLQQLPPGFQQYTQLLNLGGEANEIAPTIESPPTLEAMNLDAPAEEEIDPMMLATAAPVINVDVALTMQFAIDSKGYPLADMVLLISQLTGVPIQIDWVSFDLANVSVRDPLPTPRGFLSAHDQLQQLVEPVGGAIRIEDSMVQVTISEARFLEIVSKVTKLDDFAAERSSTIAVLNQFLTSSEQPDSEKLLVGELRSEQQILLLAVESLRRMRSMDGLMDDSQLRRWARPIDAADHQWPLLGGGKPCPPVDTPITMAELFRRCARQNNASCIVNWHDATRRGLAPEHLMMPYAKDDSGETLSRALLPYQLQVRVVDKNHWWVGTEASYDRLSVFVWTQPLGTQRDALLNRMAELMAGAPLDVFRMTYDSQSDRALMMMPRYILRQLPQRLFQKGV